MGRNKKNKYTKVVMNTYFESLKLDKSIPIPLYFQLKSHILKGIESGILSLGDQLPTENNLHSLLKISRSTIRHAVNELVQEGWLEIRPSLGTFVIRTNETPVIIQSFIPFYKLVKESSKKPKTQVLEINVIPADNEIAKSLKIQPGEKVIHLIRRRFINEKPMVIIRNFLPFSLCEPILSQNLTDASLYELLMKNPETRIDKTTTIISAEKTNSENLDLLEIEFNTPVLVTNTISENENHEIIDFAYSFYRGDMNKFKIISSPLGK